MKRLFFLLFLVGLPAFSQFKLGKVTEEELKQKSYPTDTTAAAAILFKKVDITFEEGSNNRYVLHVETLYKIKIYKKEGYDYATAKFPYYVGSNRDNIEITDAATYNLVDGKIEKIKLKSEGKFDEETSKDYKTLKITMPNVKEGSIIEYRSVHKTYNLVNVGTNFFQYEIPVKDVSYRFRYPEHFEYNIMIGGYLRPEVSREKVSMGPTQMGNEIKIKLAEIPALKDESYVNNLNNYRSRVAVELSMIRYNTGEVESFASDWNAVNENLYKHESFGPELKKTDYFEKELPAIVGDATTDQDKMLRIFNHVKKHMTWNEYRGILCDQGVRTAYKTKKGNVAEINFILTSMLRAAGLNANPVLISTRMNGIALFPSRTAYDYIATAVKINGNNVLLDATSAYSAPNILPTRCLNWVGQAIRKDGSTEEINLMPKVNSKDFIVMAATIGTDGKVSGKIRRSLTDYNAMNYRENYASMTDDSYMERLEKNYPGMEVDNLQWQNKKEWGEPLNLSYDFRHDNSVEIIGDRMYINPMLFYTQTENPFKQEKREHPVDFQFPFQDRYTFNITLPQGYKVESIPQQGMYSTNGRETVFKYVIAQNENQIQLVVTHDVNTPIFGSEQYDTLKNFYKEIITKQGEKIVLKKI